MIEQLQNFYLNKEEPVKSCLLVLRSIIIAQDKNISETQKWGMPCFCYKKRMFCFLWTDKKTQHPYIQFVEGKHITNAALEAGKRTRMKILKISPARNLPVKKIKIILKQALDLYRTGIIKIKE